MKCSYIPLHCFAHRLRGTQPPLSSSLALSLAGITLTHPASRCCDHSALITSLYPLSSSDFKAGDSICFYIHCNIKTPKVPLRLSRYKLRSCPSILVTVCGFLLMLQYMIILKNKILKAALINFFRLRMDTITKYSVV